jgi:hypothetical protein
MGRLTMASALFDRIIQMANDLENKQVKVGFFETSVYPDGQQVAYVAAINEYGCPEKHIPARPFMRPTIANKQGDWSNIVNGLINQGMQTGVMPDVLETVGLAMQGDIVQAIADVMIPELSDRTLAARRARGNGSTKPLNDTGYMIASVQSIVDGRD